VTDKTVRELANAGIVVRAGRGLYKLEESVRRYCEHLRRSQRGGEASLATLRDERIRMAKEQADALVLKNAATRGQMLDAVDVEADWSNTLRTVRAGMLAVPSRAGAALAAPDAARHRRDRRRGAGSASRNSQRRMTT
jgi:phage terminase Nu1 subunit (DNA packaging protein)